MVALTGLEKIVLAAHAEQDELGVKVRCAALTLLLAGFFEIGCVAAASLLAKFLGIGRAPTAISLAAFLRIGRTPTAIVFSISR